ncbi:MAG TPA: ABC transporter substrate-binding protein [Castellaniella sp.]|uniref:ABC transporter substrate-binding protein n=1 Tax=Castellaniella sp. TaxID=1955812 RepID=UPI002EF30D82
MSISRSSSPRAASFLSRALLGAAVSAAFATLTLAPVAAQAASTPKCELNRPMRFGGMNWESNLMLVEIERFIVKHGYGCDSEVLPTDTLLALASLERGDLDINSELWLNSTLEPWNKAKATGKVKRIGDIFMGQEAWYIPKYTAERLPGLKKASDLPKYWKDFKDPEEPTKGRFYTCPAGWACEVINGNLYKALGLEKTYTLFSPGTGATQKAALMSAYQRKQNIVFYYWSPTPLVGALDLVKLEMPPYDATKQKCLTDPDCADPQATAFPENPVFTAVNTKFSEEAPKITAFLAKVKIPLKVENQAMAYMEKNEAEPKETALWFLKKHQDVWAQWLPPEVTQRVKAAL